MAGIANNQFTTPVPSDARRAWDSENPPSVKMAVL
jgi:hypothetical protein